MLAGPLPASAAATIGVGLAALLTGGMHLDALADTADALGGRTRERRLEIMRDHSIGAFGAVALVLVLLLEVSLLAELGARDLALVSFAAAGALSRWSPLPIALALPSARDDGQGRSLATGISLAAVLVGLALAAGIAAIALGAGAARRARGGGRRRAPPRPLLPALARRRHGRCARRRYGALAGRVPGRRVRGGVMNAFSPDRNRYRLEFRGERW